MLIAMLTALPLGACPPAGVAGGGMLANERTNQQTNKHDGSQYLLAEVTTKLRI